MKIMVIMAMKTSLLTSKSEAAWRAAGATMDEETCEMKVKEKATKVAANLCQNGQLHRDKAFGCYQVCAKHPKIMSHWLTFSGYQDPLDHPN